jgi:prolipoprotein diacylglyceryltransferase
MIPAQSWRVAGRELSPFRACGVAGLAAAIAVAATVTALHGASLALEGGVIVLAVATFLSLALAMKAATGREALIHYHHEVAVLAVAASAVWLAGGPVAAHLDATALGLGAFLACGRVGCLTVGCCHGRPGRRGIRYPGGVPAYLVGRPLVPVQALESAAAAALVIAGVIVVAAGGRPGAAAALYVTGYAVARFGLELRRGDPGRRAWRTVTEAQWTSVALAGAAAVAAGGWHVAAAVLLGAAALGLAARAAPPRRALDARHVDELRRVLAQPPGAQAIAVRRTSRGIGLSRGRAAGREHYALSGAAGPQEAAELAGAILWLRHPHAGGELVAGPAGVYHLLVG